MSSGCIPIPWQAAAGSPACRHTWRRHLDGFDVSGLIGEMLAVEVPASSLTLLSPVGIEVHLQQKVEELTRVA